MHAYRKPNVKKMQAECDAFNAICPVGGKVKVKLDGVDEPFETVTISEAQILSGHSPVVWMKNVSGCYLLDRVTPIATAKPTGYDFYLSDCKDMKIEPMSREEWDAVHAHIKGKAAAARGQA